MIVLVRPLGWARRNEHASGRGAAERDSRNAAWAELHGEWGEAPMRSWISLLLLALASVTTWGCGGKPQRKDYFEPASPPPAPTSDSGDTTG
jgi:hypothetical protein